LIKLLTLPRNKLEAVSMKNKLIVKNSSPSKDREYSIKSSSPIANQPSGVFIFQSQGTARIKQRDSSKDHKN
jgi:hypothetical protein